MYTLYMTILLLGRLAAVCVSVRKIGRNTFPFPFKPYEIQQQFMRDLYNILEASRIGILESPTGTGKTMSLICGACRWLCDEQTRRRERINADQTSLKVQQQKLNDQNNNDVDWLVADYEKLKLNDHLRNLQRRIKRLDECDKNKAEIRRQAKIEWAQTEDGKMRNAVGSRQRGTAVKRENAECDVKNDDESDDENKADFLPDEPIESAVVSTKMPSIGKKNVDPLGDEEEDEDENVEKPTKIFYCCRTHSQLSQFIEQIQKSPYADKFFVVPLASRQQLCVNPAVNKLKSQSAINDRCLELKDKAGCPFLAGNLGRVKKLANRLLAEPTDIEQLASEATKGKACSYYATRYAVKKADIIVLPYNSVFHRPTREALLGSEDGLRGHVVIVDEAHNFTDAVAGVNSAQLSAQQLSDCLVQLDLYTKRYRDRLKSTNLLHVKQIRRIVAEILKVVMPAALNSAKKPGVVENSAVEIAGRLIEHATETKPTPILSFSLTLNEFQQRAGIIGSLNLCELLAFLEETRLSRKLNGFARMLAAKARKEAEKQQSSNGTNLPFESKSEGPNRKRAKPSVSDSKSAANFTKLTDFVNTNSASVATSHSTTAASSPLIHVESFLRLLFEMSCNANLNDTIRIIVEHGANNNHNSNADSVQNQSDDAVSGTGTAVLVPVSLHAHIIRIVILNVAEHVRDIFNDARSIIFAGGTMQPIDELRNHILLRAGVAPERIEFHSYGHVVPKSNVCALALGSGPSGATMTFSYESRLRSETMRELALVLLETVQIVPGGVVCFFPSYSYAETFFKFISFNSVACEKPSTGTDVSKSISFLSQMSAKKLVIREPQSSRDCDAVLQKFASAVATAKLKHSPLTGAVLFAVVGGKLSEGINFADDLCRCVVMIGLPYPNRSSVELKEKLAFLDRQYGGGTTTANNSASNAHYESLCMKAVNQSIGRAIRHKDDYALMLLLDNRFCIKANVLKALPKWLAPSLINCERGGFKQALAEMRSFFEFKK